MILLGRVGLVVRFRILTVVAAERGLRLVLLAE